MPLYFGKVTVAGDCVYADDMIEAKNAAEAREIIENSFLTSGNILKKAMETMDDSNKSLAKHLLEGIEYKQKLARIYGSTITVRKKG